MNNTLKRILSTIIYPAMATVSMVFGLSSTAQSAAYIKYDGIDGEARDSSHQGWVDLLSFGQGIHKPGGGATGQSRRRGALVQDVTATMRIDSASPELFIKASKGEVFPRVEVDLCEGTPSSACEPIDVTPQHCYLKYELSNVLITSYQINASGNDERGMVDVALNYEEIKVTYTEAPDSCGEKF